MALIWSRELLWLHSLARIWVILIKITLLLSQPAARVRCPAAANCTHRQLHFSRTQIKINGQLLEPPKIGTFHVLREIEINFGNR